MTIDQSTSLGTIRGNVREHYLEFLGIRYGSQKYDASGLY